MTTRWLSAACFVLLAATGAGAQTSMRQEVPQGDVTGLEMGVEGSLRVAPGGRLRWFVTVYEVVRGRELRPAAGTTLRVLASFKRSDPVSVVVTDGDGRAALAVDVPADVTRGFELVVEARSPRRVVRRFTVDIDTMPRYSTELHVDRTQFTPGETVIVWGRVLDVATGRPAAARPVVVQARGSGGAALMADAELQTDAAGLFHLTLLAPGAAGETFSVSATARDGGGATQGGLKTAWPTAPALVVVAVPAKRVVSPNTEIWVDVVVRTPDGRRVPRATLRGLSIVQSTREKVVQPTLTDNLGAARVPWRVGAPGAGAELSGTIEAVREGLGVGQAAVTVRVSSAPLSLTWAVEGGALIPGLPGRVLVKLTRPDGQPAAGLPVRLESDRLRAADVVTDERGVATLETTLKERASGAPADECSGDTVVAATVSAGDHQEALCLPVDPDSTVRVRAAPTTQPDQALEVQLLRSRSVAQAPIDVTLLMRAPGGGFQPLAQKVVPAASSKASLQVPAEARGLLWVRARALVGSGRDEVRGGSTAVWAAVGMAPKLSVSANPGGQVKLALSEARPLATSGFAVALPPEAGAALMRTLGAIGTPGGSAAELAGYLASVTPVDSAVYAVLREGSVAPLPAPADPAADGRLRDPQRSRARFVRGYLARVLHAIENAVATRIPDGLPDVGEHGRAGWRFNREIIALLRAQLGDEALEGLDGAPLTSEALQALDSAIVYDNVARRLTRARLMRLLVALDLFVHDNRLGYAWARRGDPSRWLNGLIEWSDPVTGEMLTRESLFDAWGRPFALRPARGGRARFQLLEPVSGYELVSAGPDGRFDTSDDLYDPTARAVPAGSLYADAVGEDVLLARLTRIELGRATLEALGGIFETAATPWEASSPSQPMSATWGSEPTLLVADAEALAPMPVGQPEPGVGAFGPVTASGAELGLALPSDFRRYLVVAGAYREDGAAAFASAPLTAGAPLALRARLPERLQLGETVRVPLALTYLGGRQELAVQVEATGSVGATSRASDASFTLEAGEARDLELELAARRVGRGEVRVLVRGAAGAVLLDSTHAVRVQHDGTLRAQHTSRLSRGESELTVELPEGAVPVRGRLVLSGPRDVLRDPGLLRLRAVAPALFAWAHTMRGEPVPAGVQDELAAWSPGGSTMTTLQAACAATSYGAAGEASSASLARALGWLRSTPPASWQERSAVLVALAASAGSPTAREANGDVVGMLVSQIREASWEAVVSEQGRPTILARLAAGLLLADRRDAVGRTLFERARASMRGGERGGQVLDGDLGRVDSWIGTAALALAARQLGEDSVADGLAEGLASQLYLGLGSDPEAGFWLLAASVFGALGREAPAEVLVEVDGVERRVPLAAGQATLDLPAGTETVEIDGDAPVLCRVEARYVSSRAAASDAPLSVRLDGHAGSSGGVAALELVIQNGSTLAGVRRPVLDLVLPGLASFTDEARQTLARVGGVVAVDAPDALGQVRIHLSAMGPGEVRRLPLPLRWLGAGEVRGLAWVAFDAVEPWRLSSSPGQKLVVLPRTAEAWR